MAISKIQVPSKKMATLIKIGQHPLYKIAAKIREEGGSTQVVLSPLTSRNGGLRRRASLRKGGELR